MTGAEQAILDHARRERPAEAVDILLRLRPRELVEATRAIIVHLVTVERDPLSAILIGWAGATRAHALAGEAPTIHGLDRELAEHARGLFFTLGSMLWPGWGAVDLPLDATACAIGRACAERASAMADELGAAALLRSRSHWLVGVHALTARDVVTARAEVVTAARLAERAGAVAETRLLRAYLLMVQAVAEPEDPEIVYELARVCGSFDVDPETSPFGQQIRVAWTVVAPDRPLPEPPAPAERAAPRAPEGRDG